MAPAKPKDIVSKMEPELENALSHMGMEVVDIQFRKENGRWIFRVFLDREQGIDLDACQQASTVIGALLDRFELISWAYSLEVSSPGLDRIIKKDRDFERFRGRKVKIKTAQPLQGSKNFTGILGGLDSGEIVLETEEETVRITRELVTQVRLVAEL